MAKLTKAQRNELREVLRHAERALKYIQKPSTAVCHVKVQATTTLDFTNQLEPGRVLAEVNKDIGSDLVGLSMAIEGLAAFIVRN